MDLSQKFTTKELDEGIDLTYFGARYYDQDLGVWTSPDAARQYHDAYSYVGGNPVNTVDPDGNTGEPTGGFLSQLMFIFGISDNQVMTPAQTQDIAEYVPDAAGGAVDMAKNYKDMREANTIGADKYFHCKGNCEAASRGTGGHDMAKTISNFREWSDQTFKGDAPSTSRADQAANMQGRNAGSNGQSCQAGCGDLKPNGLNKKF